MNLNMHTILPLTCFIKTFFTIVGAMNSTCLKKNLKVLLKFQCTKGWIFENKNDYDYKTIL